MAVPKKGGKQDVKTHFMLEETAATPNACNKCRRRNIGQIRTGGLHLFGNGKRRRKQARITSVLACQKVGPARNKQHATASHHSFSAPMTSQRGWLNPPKKAVKQYAAG
eukprot:6174378-Pleurochrysis_carterae.AAC.2